MKYWSHIAIACVFYMLQVAHAESTTSGTSTSTVKESGQKTAASVAQSAGTAAQTREDNYGYNLLQKETNTKTIQNDYDTTASANKAVAKLGRIEEKTAEDDYEHFHVTNTTSETPSSYTGKFRNRSDDYAFAGPLQ